jgi:hypothetical protein
MAEPPSHGREIGVFYLMSLTGIIRCHEVHGLANSPTYIAYHVKATTAGEQGEKRGVWTRVGAAWPNKDGRGFNVILDVVPLDGRLILRAPLERESAGGMQPSEMLSS